MRLRYNHLLRIPDFLTFSVLQRHGYVGSDTYPWSLGYRLRGTLLQLIFSAPVFRSPFSELRCLHRLLCVRTGFWIFQLFFVPPLPGLLTLLTTSGRYVEEWVRVFYATVWIDPNHHWMRFRFEREDVTITASQIRQLFGFPESTTRLHSLCYGTSDPPRRPHGGVAPGTAHVAALFRLPFSDGSRRSPADFTTAAKYLFELIRRTLLPRMGYREATTHI
jgi:hypothetical protein